jgi:glycosyltransferase involved in cell wall biosynthesis
MHKLKIGLNLLYLRPGKVGGSETYVRSILKELIEFDTLKIELYGTRETTETFEGNKNLKLVTVSEQSFSQVRRLWDENTKLTKWARKVDVLWSPANFIAPFLPSGIPQVATIHDLQHLWYPQNFSMLQNWVREILFRLTFWKAAAWIAISDFTRRDILYRYRLTPENSHSVLHGADFPQKPTEAEIRKVLEKYKLQSPFFLYPATLAPHKGHEFLIDCMEKVMNRLGDRAPKLIFTGQQVGQWETLQTQIKKLGLERHVNHFGYLPRNEVTSLMTAARALVFGSRFEGFGLPLLEAMSLGTPVLAARNTAITEVAGKGAWLIENEDSKAWTDAMVAICNDDELSKDWVQKGYENHRRFSWKKCALETFSILDKSSRKRNSARV